MTMKDELGKGWRMGMSRRRGSSQGERVVDDKEEWWRTRKQWMMRSSAGQ